MSRLCAGFLITLVHGAYSQCHDPVFSLPIQNVSVGANNSPIRGIPVSAGTPPQRLAWLPQWNFNNTWLYDLNSPCKPPNGADPMPYCQTLRGGYYSVNESVSIAGLFGSGKNGEAASGAPPNDTSVIVDSEWVADTLYFGGNITLLNHPIGVPRYDWGGDYHTLNCIGLGSNSSVLAALKSAGYIASLTWSMFWGLDGGERAAQMDGSIVFGGYDEAKVSGTNYTGSLTLDLPFSCASGIKVLITDIVLNFPNGSEPSLLSAKSEAINACIDPDYPVLMTLPYDPYFQRFENATQTVNRYGRSLGVNFYGMLYDPDEIYEGDITFTIDSDLEIKVPNSQLFVPDTYIDNYGIIDANYDTRELVINSLQEINANDLPVLGRQFLSSAYIMVDQERSSYTLWAANPTTDEKLTAVNNGACVSSPSSTTQDPNELNPSRLTHGLGKGAIAGIVVGACVGGLIIVAAILLVIVRLRKKRISVARPSYHSNMIVNSSDMPIGYHEAEGPGLSWEMQGSELESYKYVPRANGPYELVGS